jgi:hypothetical protein
MKKPLIAICTFAVSVSFSSQTLAQSVQANFSGSPDKVKACIVADLVEFGYSVDNNTEYSISLSRPVTSNSEKLALLATPVGGPGTRRHHTYTLVADTRGVRVFLSATYKMPTRLGGEQSYAIESRRDLAALNAELQKLANTCPAS